MLSVRLRCLHLFLQEPLRGRTVPASCACKLCLQAPLLTMLSARPRSLKRMELSEDL